MVINETLAQGMYNRLSKDFMSALSARFERLKKAPPGRQRRTPWFRNRVNELRRLFRDSILFEETTGEGKRRCTRFIVLELIDRQWPVLASYKVCSKDMRVKSDYVPVNISSHAMSRLIQACHGAELVVINRYLSGVVRRALALLTGAATPLAEGQILKMASDRGLFIWCVHEGSEGSRVELTLKTFIAEPVLDGASRQDYDWLRSEKCVDGYSIHYGYEYDAR